MRSFLKILDLLSTLASVIIVSLYVLGLVTGSVTVWKLFSILGTEYIYVSVAAIMYCFYPRLSYLLMSILLLSASLNILLKNIIAEPRPPPYMWKIKVSGYAFPSGHTQITSTFWYALSLYLKRPSLLVLATVLVVSVATSRVMLGVHWVQDVIGGAVIGLAVSWLLLYLYYRRGNVVIIANLAIAVLLSLISAVRWIANTVDISLAALGMLAAYPIYDRTWRYVESSSITIKLARAVLTSIIALSVLYLFRRFAPEPYSYLGYFTVPILVVVVSALAREKPKKPH